MAKPTAAALIAVAALIAAGCGNNNITTDPEPDTTEVSSEEVAPEDVPATTESPATGNSPSEFLLAAIDSTAGRAVRGQTRFEGDMVDASGENLTVDFEADAQGDVQSMLSSNDPAFPPSTVRIVDGRTYVGLPGEFAARSLPGFERLFPGFEGGTAWFTVAGADAERYAIACASPLTQFRTGTVDCDPAGDLRYLADEAEEATELAEEEVFGVPTRHLRFTVAPAGLAPTAASRDESGDLAGGFDGVVAVDVWIDADMLLRKMVVDLSSLFGGFAAVFSDDDAEVEVPSWQHVIEYREFDESISFEAPSPESLLGDFAELADLRRPSS